MKFLMVFFLLSFSITFGIKEIEIAYPSMPVRSKLMMENVIDRYHKENPTVRIKLRMEDDSLLKIISQEIEDGGGPDGFLMSYIFLKNAIHNDWLLPLNNYMLPQELLERNKYIPKYFTEGDSIYGYNTGTKGNVLFYNKNILKKYKIPKPKTSEDIPKILKIAKDKGIVPLVNDIKYSELKYSVVDDIIKYHIYMEKQNLFVRSKDIGYSNKYEAFFSGKVAFLIGFAEDADKDDFYRGVFGLIPMVKSFSLGNEFSVAYVIGKNSKHPKETLDFFRYLYRLTNGYNDYFQILI